jgi:MFS family permease
MYLCGIPISCIGSSGVAMSTSVRSLLFWRFVQTFGCSGSLSLGAGVIGDIYKLEERGTRTGIFIGVRGGCLNGSCIDIKSYLRLRFSASLSPRSLEVSIVICEDVFGG